MNWIEKIRNKPQEERIRLIWICVIITGIILLVLAIISWKYRKTAPTDPTLINTLTTGVKNAGDRLKTPKQ